MLFLAVIGLLFFGPKRLPAMGKSLGEAVKALKDGMAGLEIDVTEVSKKVKKKDPDSESES